MKEQRLLERISGLGDGQARSHQTRVEVLIESIRAHLQRILNTRQGSVPIDPDFGVPDFTNLAGSSVAGTTQEMAASMTRMVARYEPRLKAVRIQLAESGTEVLSLSFTLEGSIEVSDRIVPIRLATRVSASGRVSLMRQ
ncbi:type VI secretion system baseplate subunit TssE [Corticimicrobacter populi]|uniref:Type VI secretion system baseplate subunit TssE n=1 Tax=Corticimicrobacter populi TaxID=2175229 RepID=A0A2V1K3J0_9BURK|nr:type VI secretion system baseplate subunit TssE [Corticimicrobacter populi]PWF24793.1 type VI secretion system baseplate subunit TssE [Corticimicrobacter populi]QDQ86797.1 type VI secretion system baseplate subunit TssE [Alcaligenaceae bacterium SJ-26]